MTKPDQDPVRTYAAPSLAVDPENPDIVIAASVEMRTGRCKITRTMDGGQTWQPLQPVPALPDHPLCFTAQLGTPDQLAFGRNHTLYLAMPARGTGDGGLRTGNLDIILNRSTDLGTTWTTTVVRAAKTTPDGPRENNRPMGGIAVDSHSGSQDVVYVVWRRNYYAAPPPPRPMYPLMAVSTDGGRTFGDPIDLTTGAFDSDSVRAQAVQAASTCTVTGQPRPPSAPEANVATNYGSVTPGVAVDDRGTVYAAWPSGTANISPAPPTGYFLSRSTDHGRTFGVTQIVPFACGNGPFSFQLVWSPRGGSEGSLHFVYESSTGPARQGPKDIEYTRSLDGGKTWTQARTLNDEGAGTHVGHRSPALSLAPGGRLDAAWWDSRDDPAARNATGTTPTGALRYNDVYLTSSTDEGLTWSKNRRITDQSIDRFLGVFAGNFGVYSPPGLAAADAATLVAWDDTRNSRETADAITAAPKEGLGVQDIYAAVVRFQPAADTGGGLSRTALALLISAEVALALIGAGLLAVAVVRRRRRSAAGDEAPPQT